MQFSLAIETILKRMTLEEKAAFLSGKNEWQSHDFERLGIPSVFFSDGPHGVRRQAGAGDHLGLNPSLPATCFPTAATIANSWDESLGEELGRALGEEARALGVDVLLGPGLNIKRSPLCGRNFEYFSEDPYLAGKMAASYVRGIQSQGAYACPKHFAVNSQEQRRMAMNSVLDERTLREIYLTGFEIAVKEGGAKAIMTSYNEVNGTYANENSHLLRDILREEWGFDGIVVTDWGGSNDHVEGVKAGSTLEMPNPGYDSARQIVKAVKEGALAEEILDARVKELLRAALELHGEPGGAADSCEGTSDSHVSEFCPESGKEKDADNHSGEQKDRLNDTKEKAGGHRADNHPDGQDGGRIHGFDADAHHALARRAAAGSAVLLKNADGLLPLSPNCRVAVIGDFAVTPRYQGAGSSMVNPTRLDTAEQLFGDCGLRLAGIAKGYQRNGAPDEELKEGALRLAAAADVVLYFFGLDEVSESEGLDRAHMRIPGNQAALLEALAKVNPNVVGILSAGSSIEMPWHACCRAILHGYLNGQAGAGAVLDLLTGKINPSGKLAETYPIQGEDTPAFVYFPAAQRNAEYREGLYVGYRYYDKAGVNVRYPFGFGLSYTTFAYSGLEVGETGISFTLTNTGTRDGAETAQMYVSLPNTRIFRPERELKGFRKVFLKAGESRRVEIGFDDKTFRYWNVHTNRWEIEEGTYRIEVGSNVREQRLTGSISVKGTTPECPYRKEKMPSYYTGRIQKVSDQEFEQLLGGPVPSGEWAGELGLNDALCQMYYAKNPLARLVCRILRRLKERSEAKGTPDLNLLFIYNIPFRGIAKMTAGAVSMEMAGGMVEAVNGHFFRGMRKVIGGFFKNAKQNRAYVARIHAGQAAHEKNKTETAEEETV